MSESADDVSQATETEATKRAEQIARLDSRLDGMWDKVEQLEETIDKKNATIELLREDLESERESRRQLERRVDEIDARTDMMQFVENVDNATFKQRTSALFQHLWRKAKRNQSQSDTVKAVVDYDDADEALSFPDIKRPTLYSDMRRVAEWVADEDVCWYDDGEVWLDLGAVNGSVTKPGDLC